MKITIICDNYVKREGLLAEHGLSFLIENNKQKILFDTGQGVAIKNNIEKLDIDVSKLDKIIMSHGHYDHTGGLEDVLIKAKDGIKVYCHQDVFLPRYRVSVDKKKYIGIVKSKSFYENLGCEFEFYSNRYDDDNFRIYSDIENDPAMIDGGLSVEKNGVLEPDSFNDDSTLVFDTKLGKVIILGCAHSGIINIINHISEKENEKEFFAIIGGSHLSKVNCVDIDRVISTFENFNFQKIVLNHCTGFNASAILKNHFKEKFIFSSVGDIFEF